jgi:redox-sensitive bicupin YhaK (pirin superfamily)
MKHREIENVFSGKSPHMVGDGFRVTNYLPAPGKINLRRTSPFFLLDYNEPYDFPPTPHRKGVGTHPHRGFETVTFVYEGYIEHRDSSGGGGVIGPGDVQWMTAANGILHDEFQTQEVSEKGGRQHMLQLWVNLPAKHKKSPPKYQSIKNEQISTFKVDDKESIVRVVAGTFNSVKGPASTFTPIEMYDIRLKSGSGTSFQIPASHNTFLLVTKGSFKINGSQEVQFKDFVLFENRGELIELDAMDDSYAILFGGEPIEEPIAHYGPFLMNTQEEIRESIESFNAGKFGDLE